MTALSYGGSSPTICNLYCFVTKARVWTTCSQFLSRVSTLTRDIDTAFLSVCSWHAGIVWKRLNHRRNLRGVPVPQLFGLGYRTPTFQDEKVKKLLSSAVNRGDLRRLNYNETVFGRSSAPNPAKRTHDALQDPELDGEGIHTSRLLPSFFPCHLGTITSLSFWIGIPHFLDQSYAPGLNISS